MMATPYLRWLVSLTKPMDEERRKKQGINNKPWPRKFQYKKHADLMIERIRSAGGDAEIKRIRW